MKKYTLTLVTAVIFLMFLGGSAWAGGKFAHRQRNQVKRIHRGLRTGSIDHKQFVRLRGEQRKIRAFRREARADGYFSHEERRRLHRMQRRADRHIYHAKHHPRGHWRWKRHRRYYDLHFRRFPRYDDWYGYRACYRPFWSLELWLGPW